MFSYESIAHYHDRLRNGSTTCAEAVRFYLQQIDGHRHLNAFVQVYAREAAERAAELDRQRREGRPMGRLHGVVIALKDVIAYRQHPVTAASRILKDFVSLYSATAVRKMLDEEAIIIGHTNCDEFAMGSTNELSAYGPVLNGMDPDKVPGGSSGGSAVAVQTGCCMLSLGSDTGGSVRQPADFCGIVGLKPSYGRVSRYGLIAYASSFDQIGIFGKSIPDVALLLEVISGPDEFDSTARQEEPEPYSRLLEPPPSPLKIAIFKEAIHNQALDPEIRTRLLQFIKQLRSAGNTVEEIDFEYLQYIVPTYYVLTTAEASSNLSRFDGVKYGHRAVDKYPDLAEFYCQTRSEGFGTEVKRRIMLGTFVLSAGYYDAYFTKAQQVRQLLVDKTNLIFKDFDAILSPTAPTTAFSRGEKLEDPIAMYMADIFTVFSNLTGLPGISIPLFWHNNGLPFGVQVMTNRFCELYLLRLSQHWLQQYRLAGSIEKP